MQLLNGISKWNPLAGGNQFNTVDFIQFWTDSCTIAWTQLTGTVRSFILAQVRMAASRIVFNLFTPDAPGRLRAYPVAIFWMELNLWHIFCVRKNLQFVAGQAWHAFAHYMIDPVLDQSKPARMKPARIESRINATGQLIFNECW